MKIIIGSTNGVKVNAVSGVMEEYEILRDAIIVSRDVKSEVSPQPKTLEETVSGAVNRARNACLDALDCDLGFGIESGFIDVPYTLTGKMNVCVCAIFDHRNIYIGISPAFEIPPMAMPFILDGATFNDAFFKAGLTNNPKIGKEKGVVDVLTNKRMSRKDYTILAIRMAMIRLEKREYYQ